MSSSFFGLAVLGDPTTAPVSDQNLGASGRGCESEAAVVESGRAPPGQKADPVSRQAPAEYPEFHFSNTTAQVFPCTSRRARLRLCSVWSLAAPGFGKRLKPAVGKEGVSKDDRENAQIIYDNSYRFGVTKAPQPGAASLDRSAALNGPRHNRRPHGHR